MKVLIACEESQRVCIAFRERGHEAYSCDIQDCSGGHPEWHIKGDALEAMRGGTITTCDGVRHDIGKWDLLIAHPPCTYLTASSAVRLYGKNHEIKDPDRDAKGWAAKDFLMQLYTADIPLVAVENPAPLHRYGPPQYTQIIEPYMYGDPWKKRTCLWLRGLPPLAATNVVEPLGLWVGSTSARAVGTGRIKSTYTLPSHRDPRIRSKTFPGIAEAMAEQWGGGARTNG